MAKKSQKASNKAKTANKDTGTKKKSNFAIAQQQAAKMQPKKKQQSKQQKKKGNRFMEYFKGVKLEMKKVVWPTRKELGSFTAVVLCTCAAFALVFWGVDSGVLAAIKAICF